MFHPSKELEEQAKAYATARDIELEYILGGGKDGDIYSTSVRTAVKAFRQEETFRRELRCYVRLKEMGVQEVLGLHVPQLRGVNERFRIVEMSIVQPPFLLDFASVYLDESPDFSEDVMEMWQHNKQEEFGNRWGEVMVVLEVLHIKYGIHLLDVHPGNITFGESNP